MKKIARLIILLAAFLTSTALAHPFDTVNYECKQLDPGRDGIKCLVRYEGSVPVLYIRYLYTRASPKTIQERGTYLVTVMRRNFAALGGSAIQRRFTLDGIPAQQLCSPYVRDRRRIICSDPVPVKDLENHRPWPL